MKVFSVSLQIKPKSKLFRSGEDKKLYSRFLIQDKYVRIFIKEKQNAPKFNRLGAPVVVLLLLLRTTAEKVSREHLRQTSLYMSNRRLNEEKAVIVWATQRNCNAIDEL